MSESELENRNEDDSRAGKDEEEFSMSPYYAYGRLRENIIEEGKRRMRHTE